MVDLEAVAVVLDRRHPPSPASQLGNELLDQRGLARTGFSDNGNDRDHGRMMADRKRIGHSFLAYTVSGGENDAGSGGGGGAGVAGFGRDVFMREGLPSLFC
jgi:hypothetical protein